MVGISEGAQFVKRVPKGPSGVLGVDMRVEYRPMGATRWPSENPRTREGGQGRPETARRGEALRARSVARHIM